MQSDDASPTTAATMPGQAVSWNSERSQEAYSLPVPLSIRLSLPAAVK